MNEPDFDNSGAVALSTSMVEIEKSRAVQEVQAMMVIAKKFPRDMVTAYNRIIKQCERYSLAEQGVYSFPRGNEIVTGPSIRLAEVMAQNWGNLDFGIRELERRSGVSIAESYCWDLETNVRQTKIFEVPHEIELKGGKKKILTSPRDIYEIVANNGARRLRACILGIIPGDISEAAEARCRQTMEKGDGKKTLVQRIRDMVEAFEKIGVTQAMIEKRLKHEIGITVAQEIVEMTSVYHSVRDKQASRWDFFDNPNAAEEGKNSEASEKLKAAAAAKKKAPEPEPVKDTDPESFNNFQG